MKLSNEKNSKMDQNVKIKEAWSFHVKKIALSNAYTKVASIFFRFSIRNDSSCVTAICRWSEPSCLSLNIPKWVQSNGFWKNENWYCVSIRKNAPIHSESIPKIQPIWITEQEKG